MIPYNPTFLDNVEIFKKDELELLEQLNSKLTLKSFLQNKNLVNKLGLDFIHTSAQIEGNTYDKLDTVTLLEHGRTAGGKKYSDAKMILNLREAYDLLIVNDFKVSKDTLKNIHYIVSNEMVAKNERATPRDEEVHITESDYIPLSSKQKLDDELNYLFKKYNQIENPYNKAIYLHNNLAYLQYFRDCNKRTARIMLNISLKDSDKMIYIPNEADVKVYLASLVNYYETGNYDNFKKYFIESYKKIVNIIDFIEEQNSKINNFSREALDEIKEKMQNSTDTKIDTRRNK